MAGRIGGNDRSGLRKAVALEHRNADGAVITLELNVKQGAATDEELHAAAEILAYCLENQLVKEGDERLLPDLENAAAVVILLVVGNSEVQCEIVELLHLRTLGLDGSLDILLEIAGKSRNRKHHVRAYFLDSHRDIAESSHRGLSDRYCSDTAAVGHHRIESGNVGEAMVERQDDEHDRVRLNGHYRVSLLHIGGIVPVSQENALRVGSGSRGVADIGIVVRSDGSVAGLEFARMLLQEGIAERKHLRHCDFIVPAVLNLVEDNDFLQCRKFTHNPPDFRELGAGNHHETGIRMTDTEDEVTPLLQLDGKRNVDRSGIENTEFSDYP